MDCDMGMGFLDSLLQKEFKTTTLTFGSRSLITIPYTPISMIRGGPHVHVRGVVVYTSGLEAWDNCESSGEKMCFDLADESGVIRIFAWHEAAKKAVELIKKGQTIALMNLSVYRRRPQYNNVDHSYELEFEEDVSQVIKLRENSIEVKEDVPCFLSFEKVRKSPENVYFSVIGKVVDIGPVEKGLGFERETKWTRRFIYIKNNEGDHLKIVSWNEHVPIFSEAGLPVLQIGSFLSVIRAKWVSEWDNVNASGAQIEIDGKRVR